MLSVDLWYEAQLSLNQTLPCQLATVVPSSVVMQQYYWVICAHWVGMGEPMLSIECHQNMLSSLH